MQNDNTSVSVSTKTENLKEGLIYCRADVWACINFFLIFNLESEQFVKAHVHFSPFHPKTRGSFCIAANGTQRTDLSPAEKIPPADLNQVQTCDGKNADNFTDQNTHHSKQRKFSLRAVPSSDCLVLKRTSTVIHQ